MARRGHEPCTRLDVVSEFRSKPRSAPGAVKSRHARRGFFANLAIGLVLFGCASKPFPVPGRSSGRERSVAASAAVPPRGRCAPPADARRVVIGVEKHVVPHGKLAFREAAEATADGVCTSEVACATVAPETIAAWSEKLRAARFRHLPRAASRDHGASFIEVRWEGGSCSLEDSSASPLVADDLPAFRAVYDSVLGAVAAARAAPAAARSDPGDTPEVPD
jgi:hypothetical protein